MCGTLRPAGDVGEQRTLLLIGEFGDADKDPWPSLMILADGPQVNFRGTLSPEHELAQLEKPTVEIWSKTIGLSGQILAGGSRTWTGM